MNELTGWKHYYLIHVSDLDALSLSVCLLLLCWVSVAEWAFLWLWQQELLSGCGAWSSLRWLPAELRLCWELRASVVVAAYLSRCGSPALETGSIVVMHRLGCSEACVGSSQIRNPTRLLLWQVDSIPLSHGEAPETMLHKLICRFNDIQ